MTIGGDGKDLFESLYKRYYARMLRYFRTAFRASPADAEEMTQDSFVRLFKSMDEYGEEPEWPALIATIAKRVGLNRLRSQATLKRGSVRTESLDDTERVKEPRRESNDPMDDIIRAERLRRLQDAIETLPLGQRRCVQLWLEDLSSEEIARILRISVVAAKSRVRDAKRALRERLGDEDALPEDES